jgi:hypothetical protein
MMDHRLTRREFLAGTGAVALGGALGPRPCAEADEAPKTPDTKTRVILVRDADVLSGEGKVQSEVLEDMLDRAVIELFGVETVEAAWGVITRGAKRPGIKTNVWRMLRTPPELEAIMKRRIAATGFPEGEIPVDDRGALRTLVGCDTLINVRPLRTHYWAGIGGCIKNCIMFSESPPAWHPNGCVDLGGLFHMQNLKGKCRLHVLVVLTPLFHGKGPHHYDPRYVWDYKGLLVSTDPVAVDATGVRLLVAKRREFFGEEVPFETHTKHVEVAETKHGIGVADPAKIELVKLGWEEDILI